MIEQRVAPARLQRVLPEYKALRQDKQVLGLALHRQFDLALALVNGLAAHSGAVLGEAYRRKGPFVLDKLLA